MQSWLASAKRLAELALYREDWTIGVVGQPAADIVAFGVTAPVNWLKPPCPASILADPACEMHPNGARTLYAECLRHGENRGEIWSAEVPAAADPAAASFRPLLAAPTHLSYPFPFRDDDGSRLLTAEMWQAGGLSKWRFGTQGWQPDGVLMPNRKVVDPTLWRGPDRWWLFCGFEDDLPNERLHLFHTPCLGRAWTAHAQNPVRQDRGAARSAGPVFAAGDLLIRPAQDCANTYGGAVVLHAIRYLDPDRFVEEPIRRLDPSAGPYPHGLHTFCPAGNVTLIDGKRLRPDLAGAGYRLRMRFAAKRSN
jgi:hypothetical protein